MKPYHHHAIPSFELEPVSITNTKRFFIVIDVIKLRQSFPPPLLIHKKFIATLEEVDEKVEGERGQTNLGA